MFKYLLCITVFVMALGFAFSPAIAEEEVVIGGSITDVIVMPAIPDKVPLIDFSTLNVQADVLYLIRDGRWAAGAGTEVGTAFDGKVSLRLEFASVLQGDIPDMIGFGISAMLPELVTLSGGKWGALGINPSIGVVGLINLDNNLDPQMAMVLNAVKMEF